MDTEESLRYGSRGAPVAPLFGVLIAPECSWVKRPFAQKALFACFLASENARAYALDSETDFARFLGK